MDVVAQTLPTAAVHEIIKQTRPPLSEMDSSRIKHVQDRTKDRANVHLRVGLERLLQLKVALLCGFCCKLNP